MSDVQPRRVKSRLRPERRIAEIMRAAREVFRERGYEDALISEIALRAEVVEGTLYRYFDSKRDLLVKVAEAWYDELLADFDEQLKGVRGTRNRLRFMIWKHLSTIEQEPALCRLVFQELRPGPDYRETTVFELNREYTRRTVDILREGVDAGEFRDDISLKLVRDMIFGCIEHQTWNFVRGRGTLSSSDAADAIADLLYHGLAAHRPLAPDAGGQDGKVIDRLEKLADRLEKLARPKSI